MNDRMVALRSVPYAEARERDVDRPCNHLAVVFCPRRSTSSETCRQIALAIRDEVAGLEAAGIRIIGRGKEVLPTLAAMVVAARRLRSSMA